MNPRISRAHMETLVTDRIARVRGCAAANGLMFPDDEQLLRLAQDRSAGVRWAVLFRVDRPREAIETIAEDVDELNHHHARLALANVHSIMTLEVEKSVRAARKRVRELRATWENPPDLTVPAGGWCRMRWGGVLPWGRRRGVVHCDVNAPTRAPIGRGQ